MKKIRIILILLVLCITFSVAACGTNNSNPNDPGKKEDPIERKDSTEDDEQEEKSQISSYITLALGKLDEVVNPVIAQVGEESLKSSIQNYYNTEKQYLNEITSLDTAKKAANKVVEDTKAFVVNTLKPLAIEKINDVINPLIDKIPSAEIKTSVQTFYNTEIGKVSSVESLSELVDLFDKIISDTKEYIKTETVKIVTELKNKALQELDPYVAALINKIPYDVLRNDTQQFYTNEKKKLEAVDAIEEVTPCVEEIKKDLENYALSETKKIAISKLDELVIEGLAKLPNETIKADLTAFSKQEIAKLNAVEKIEDVPSTLQTVLTETTAHIKTLLVNTVKDYIARLTAIESATAYDYLPVAMNPNYSNNVVTANSISYDFTSPVNVTSIDKSGYGEQWQMVVENINQSILMAKVFNVAQTALNAAGNMVNIYLENSYADEMSYSFEGAGFTGLFEFKNAKLIFNISLINEVNIPVIGIFKPIIKMEYDLTKEAKGMYISLGDAYAIKYVVSNNSYEMATTYGITIAGQSASRTSYLSINKEDNKTTGHIYEYTTLKDSDIIKACVDFYVENGYVSVVGNKASGLIGFDGYINELYSANEGRLLGYEVREELTIAGITGTYNTLWFNLWDIRGIDSVKISENNEVFINGSATAFNPTYNYKIIRTSRKYDIEYRSRFYYTYDAENNVYVANEVKIPMIFIQEGENYDSFESDIKKDNNITATVILNQNHLSKILADYDTLIDIFIQNKELMSSENIKAYLNQYK